MALTAPAVPETRSFDPAMEEIELKPAGSAWAAKNPAAPPKIAIAGQPR
jgi:hypothetical protein